MSVRTHHPPSGTAGATGEPPTLRWASRSLPFARTLRASRGRTASFGDVHAALRRLEQHEHPEAMFGAAAEEAVHACDLVGAAVCSLYGHTLVLESASVQARPDLSDAAVALARSPARVDP